MMSILPFDLSVNLYSLASGKVTTPSHVAEVVDISMSFFTLVAGRSVESIGSQDARIKRKTIFF